MTRRVLVCVDDSDECEKMFHYVLSDVLKDGDELHIAHVIPKLQLVQLYGVPPVDFMPQQSPEMYQQLIEAAEAFVSKRCLQKLPRDMTPQPVVHIIKGDVDADSIGHVLCRKGEQLQAAVVCVASHSHSRVHEFFLGSVATYVAHHCKQPVLVYRA